MLLLLLLLLIVDSIPAFANSGIDAAAAANSGFNSCCC
jgi:hypothetical protein